MRIGPSSHAGPALLAVATLALGLGASVAVFSVTDAVLVRPLPVRDSQTLVRLFSTDARGGSDHGTTAVPVFRAFRERARSLAGLALFREGVLVHAAGPGQRPEPAFATIVSGEYFGVLGVTAAAGRVLGPQDDRTEGAHPVMLISHAFWERRFAGAPDALGAVLRLNGRPFTVVGVAPRGFQGVGLEQPPDLFVSLAMSADVEPVMRGQLEFWSSAFFHGVGRLAPGATLPGAQRELDGVARSLGAGAPGKSWPETEDAAWRLPWPHLRHARDVVGLGSQRLARTLSLAVSLLLLIACADAGGVLLARAARRRRELAVRVALGASRWQLVRERFAEGLLLGGVAAILGGPVAIGLLELLIRQLPDPPPLPVAAATELLSLRALALMGGLGLLTGALAAVAPAMRAWAADPLDALKGDRRAVGFGRLSAGHVLATLQVAASLALLSAGALLLRSSWNAAQVDVGFEPRPLLVASLNLARGGYDVPRALAFQERLRAALAALPEVESAAVGIHLPTRTTSATTVESEGQSRTVAFNFVSPGYLETTRLRLLAGRDIDATDVPGGPPVALVNEELARVFWPGADPIGKRIRFGPRQASLEVVGVVRYRADGFGPAKPMFLGSRSQLYGTFPWQPRTALYVRARAGDPRRLAPAVARVVESLDPDLPLLGVRTGEEELGVPLAQQRLLLATLAVLSGIALVLTFAGVFGVVASATDERRREIGVRVAVGARPSQIVTLVLGQAARLVGSGLVLGTPLVLGTGPMLSAFLLGVKPYDAVALAAAAVVLALAGLCAACGPARRALALEPTLALRAE